jgi:hypothetical protein
MYLQLTHSIPIPPQTPAAASLEKNIISHKIDNALSDRPSLDAVKDVSFGRFQRGAAPNPKHPTRS